MTEMEKPGYYSAVAVQLDKENAGTILARGEEELAREIIALAEENNIPITRDAALVSVLMQLDMSVPVPEELMQVIAGIMTFLLEAEAEQELLI